MNLFAVFLGFVNAMMVAGSVAFGSWATAALFFCMLVMLMTGEVVDAIKEQRP